jgi:hypothetical protein
VCVPRQILKATRLLHKRGRKYQVPANDFESLNLHEYNLGLNHTYLKSTILKYFTDFLSFVCSVSALITKCLKVETCLSKHASKRNITAIW